MNITVEDAYREWSDDLGRYATVLVGRDDAADVVADAVVALLGSEGWDRAREKRAYLFRAVLNAARMHHRSTGRRSAREERVIQFARSAPPADAPVDRGLWESVTQLSPQQRAVVYLAYWEDHPPARIAEILDVSEGTVRRQLARARTRLRRWLDEQPDR